ncbi:MAG: hypothetical protein AAGF87_18805 [Bacteroidota bacterium]
MNKLFLWLTRQAAPLWSALGADPQAMVHILRAKLKIDDRGGYAFGRQSMNSNGNMAFFAYFFITLFGLVLVFLPAGLAHQPTAMGLVFSAWFVFIGFMLISEMSESMFDLRDLQLLLTKPINDLTFSLSRGLHVLVFTSKFTLCLAIGLIVYFIVWRGPLQLLAFLFVGIWAAVLTMSATLALYLVLLRKVETSRLRKVIGWMQIILGIFFFTLYQLPSLLDLDGLSVSDFKLVDDLSAYWFPPLWLGALWGLLSGFAMEVHGLIQAALGFGIVIAGAWFYVSQSKGYGEKLMKLSLSSTQVREEDRTSAGGSTNDQSQAPSSSTQKELARPQRYANTAGISGILARFLTRDGVERASFLFHWRMMIRDMGFKQRTYPSMVFVPVLFALMFFRDNGGESVDLERDVSFGVLLLYVFTFTVIGPMIQIKVSDTPQAAWIFYNLPNGRSGSFKYGQFIAIFGQFFLIPALILIPLLLWFVPAISLWDVLLALANMALLGLFLQSLESSAPFSTSKENMQGKAIGPTFATMFLIGMLGFLHWILAGFAWVLVGASLLMWAILIAVVTNLRRS